MGDGEDDVQASVAMPARGYDSVPGNGAVSASFSMLPVGAGSGMIGIGLGDGALKLISAISAYAFSSARYAASSEASGSTNAAAPHRNMASSNMEERAI